MANVNRAQLEQVEREDVAVVGARDGQYHPVPYADLGLPPITLWEQRAAIAKLRTQGEMAPAQATMFKAVLDQRELIIKSTKKTKAARRQLQRQKDAAVATTASPFPGRSSVDNSTCEALGRQGLGRLSHVRQP